MKSEILRLIEEAKLKMPAKKSKDAHLVDYINNLLDALQRKIEQIK